MLVNDSWGSIGIGKDARKGEKKEGGGVREGTTMRPGVAFGRKKGLRSESWHTSNKGSARYQKRIADDGGRERGNQGGRHGQEEARDRVYQAAFKP